MEIASDQQNEELASLVKRHLAVYESYPAVIYTTAGKRETVGFDLTLIGTHALGHDLPPPQPGCPQCQEVWLDLERIAKHVIPKERHDSFYEIRPFDFSLHLAPERHMRRDVELVINIRHRENYLGPLNRCETDCLTEMTHGLRALGAREKVPG